MIRVNEVKFDVNEALDNELIIKKLSEKMKINKSQIRSYKIVRESIDARKRLVFSYSIDVEVESENALINKGFKVSPPIYAPWFENEKIAMTQRPLIIGFGPAGMFAGMVLAKAGLNPIIIEQGEPVDERTQTVSRLWEEGILNPHSNVQFGEGGAGTFSDGKLTTRIKDNRVEYVVESLIKFGAPQEIRYKNKPHVGTDKLKLVVKNMRNEILSCGGEVLFNTKVKKLKLDENGNICGIYATVLETNEDISLLSSHVVLAIGHSSRELLEMINEQGIKLEAKPFAVGVRIEHPQLIVNASQYGEYYKSLKLGAADYKLTYKAQNSRSVYSFCMCPGGSVVASASEPNRLVINGMSEFARDLLNSNSALLVNIEPSDYEDKEHGVLSGMYWQRKLEEAAFIEGGRGYFAPFMTLGDFIEEAKLGARKIEENIRYYQKFGIDYNNAYEHLASTYKPGIRKSNFKNIFPAFVIEALTEGIKYFGEKIKGFDDPRAILTAVESRSSSPVRIPRDPETLQSVNTNGLYPCGEGAGYAGGITSSAVDGIKVAEAIIKSVTG